MRISILLTLATLALAGCAKPKPLYVLFDVNPGIKPGSTMNFTFTFADGERILQTAGVIAAGDPAPK